MILQSTPFYLILYQYEELSWEIHYVLSLPTGCYRGLLVSKTWFNSQLYATFSFFGMYSFLIHVEHFEVSFMTFQSVLHALPPYT